MKTIESITIKRMFDYGYDSSYLDQVEFKERKKQFENEEFYFVGIQAYAVIGLIKEGTEYKTLQEISSGGLWGIESDSSEDYFKSLEKEELNDLKEQLQLLGFTASQFDKACKNIERLEE